ncbi:hypothetical protein [Microvirga sp. VF16]|uniref:DUF6894 family protein n=1 Tax=Microvirga sp. VF16 TaxID=2807101 RepID=UPI00193D2895|nr:hypothetical protein [Microvirga sp. VF16]QRM31359.1 hypothetical protein JO965_10415 [Microvirga sp. VF16]
MSYEVGREYPDVATAWSAVVRAARTLKQVFVAQGHDPQDYAIEVENETGEVVFRLPFSEILRPLVRQSPTTYKLVGSDLGWLIYCDNEFVGGVPRRSSAELLVWEMVETRCAEHRASQVLIEDEFICEKHLCRCFEKASPATLLS